MPDHARIAATVARWKSAAAAIACLMPLASHAEESPAVATIEAAYLTKFPAFVEWPAGGPTALCVLAPDAVGQLIEQAESKLPADASPAPVLKLAPTMPALGCGVLFVADQEAPMPPQAPATLLVTDQAAEGRKGVINFVIRDDRVRFEIDDAEAARRGLIISSKLLSLAVAVKPRA